MIKICDQFFPGALLTEVPQIKQFRYRTYKFTKTQAPITDCTKILYFKRTRTVK